MLLAGDRSETSVAAAPAGPCRECEFWRGHRDDDDDQETPPPPALVRVTSTHHGPGQDGELRHLHVPGDEARVVRVQVDFGTAEDGRAPGGGRSASSGGGSTSRDVRGTRPGPRCAGESSSAAPGTFGRWPRTRGGEQIRVREGERRTTDDERGGGRTEAVDVHATLSGFLRRGVLRGASILRRARRSHGRPPAHGGHLQIQLFG